MFRFVLLLLLMPILQSYGSDLRCRAVFRPTTIFTSESAPGAKKLRWNLTKGTPDSYASLKALAHLNLENPRLSRSDQNALHSWIDIERFTPVLIRGIKAERTRHYRPRPDRPRYLSCGTCEFMLNTHMKATILPALHSLGKISSRTHQRLDVRQAISAGKFILIRVKGELVGAVKLLSAEDYRLSKEGYFEYPPGSPASPIATPSFLSFRNVQNEKGELVLAMGGVYMLPKVFIREHIYPEVNKQGPFFHDIELQATAAPPNTRKFLRDYKLGVVDVEAMTLKPETFLFNPEGVESPSNRALLDTLYPDPANQLSYRKLMNLISSTATERDNITSMKQRWMSFLEDLALVRDFYEQQLRQDPELNSLRREFEAQGPRPDIDDPVVYQINN